MNEELKHFKKLFQINVNDKTEKKSNGTTSLTYLSWCYAWAEVKKMYPDAIYVIKKFGEQQLPYVFDEKTGYMVFTEVTIEGITHEMWLPVMDSANKAMKDKPYTYNVAKYGWENGKKIKTGEIEKKVESATMFDINKTIMRCLTKNLSMFGLGLYIYSGEDLPENIDNEESAKKQSNQKNKNDKTPYDFQTNDKEKISNNPCLETQKQRIKDYFNEEQIKNHLRLFHKKKLSELTYDEAEMLLDSHNKEIEKKVKEEEEIF